MEILQDVIAEQQEKKPYIPAVLIERQNVTSVVDAGHAVNVSVF